MYSPKISEQLIPIIYLRAKNEKKPMTKIVNELLLASLTTTYYCHNCNNQIEADTGSNQGYCDYCDSQVFLKTTTR